MRIARFSDQDGQIRYGIAEGDAIAVADGSALSRLRRTGRKLALNDVRLLAPIAPCNVLALGRNYRAHAEEVGGDVPQAPLLFMKATSAVIGPEEPILLPNVAPDSVDYEAELAVIIRDTARHVSEREALHCVLGYTCANDVSARDCQSADGQWARAKSFDTFAPLGPWIETELDPGDCDIRCRLNGRLMQDANTSLMIFNVPYVISYLSRCMTLLPGTVILTGTPAGCGFVQTPPVWLRPGDIVEVEIDGIGVLRNPVRREEQ